MKKSTIITIVIVVIVVILGLYWLMSSNSTTQEITPQDNSSATSETTGSPTLTLSTNDTIGDYLTASNGMTLYTYKNDSYNVSTCTDTCTTNWPPYTVPSNSDNLTVSGTSGIVGTITRPDGTYQVTYNGIPLYFYSNDTVQGDMNGNNVNELWTVAVPPVQSGS